MMTLAEAAQAAGAQLSEPRAGAIAIDAVSTDTRESLAGKLFIALKGERFDAHDFLAQAAAQGAVAAMVDSREGLVAPAGLPLLKVEDTRTGFGRLAANWRNRFAIPVIGITGSNGKTTVKEMCAAILRAWLGPDAVLATQGNLNNDIGVPTMLLRLHAGHRAAIIEMGMNHPGEMAWLVSLVRPDVSIVTNAQRAHLEGMGGLHAVAVEKGEVYRALEVEGIAVINADDSHAGYWRENHGAGRCVSFGLDHAADVSAEYSIDGLQTELKLTTPQGAARLTLQVPGVHNVRNALGAVAATLSAGVPLEAVVQGLAGFTGTKGRLQRKIVQGGATLLDDTYNANPDSVRAGIEVLAAMPGRKFLVLGDMGEIGSMSAQYHDEIGGYAKSAGIDRLFALGEQSRLAARNFGEGGVHYESPEALVADLSPLLGEDVVVLVKGSRFMRMERVADALQLLHKQN
jgi:UDP-N-acetylmuramoyl-tripeptide--D-alanyl-D-alanine ligase